MTRRGTELELYVNGVIADLAKLGLHGHKNNALRTIKGITLQGESFDYEIFLPTHIHAFDAKECSHAHSHWYLSSFTNPNSNTARQLNALTTCQLCPYVKAYFLVWFRASSLLREISPAIITSAIAQGKSYLTPDDGVEWSVMAELGRSSR